MIWLYRLLFPPAMLLAAPYYLRRMFKRGGYGRNFMQRFGRVPMLPAKRPGVHRIWLQAVSVGEMLAIAPLLEALRREPGIEVYLTTTTSTGYRIALERYAGHTIGIGYFPVDAWFFSAAAWRQVQPDLVVLTEGERWPEHIRQASVRGVPVVCVNARMSDRGYRRMRRFRGPVLSLFGGITRWLPCSRQDADRLIELGFPRERITTTGNIKLDLTIPPLSPEERATLLGELGFPAGGSVLLGSSTWPGEEAALLGAFGRLRAEGREVSLLLVPRHAERREEVNTLLRESGLPFHFRSRGAAPGPVRVCVADTTGELRRLTQLADLVFVGKSLPPHHEGQTPVEAAALGKPVLFGPEMSNFREIARQLTGLGAARVVKDPGELASAASELLASPDTCARMASAAKSWHAANQGALSRTITQVLAELPARKAG